MHDVEPLLLAGSALVVAGVLASKLASRLGIPALLLFLAVGMAAGSDGLGGIRFDDAGLALSIGVVALALILFDGGLSTQWSTVRPALGQSAVLATVGVAITATITGLTAICVFGVPVEVGLLLGAIVSSTDAAAVFSVLGSRRTVLRGTIQPTLELESGLNDPIAVFLTLGLVELATGETESWWALLPMFGLQLVGGAVVGLFGGWLGRLLVNQIRLGHDGLYPVLMLAVALGTYAGAVLIGGSGFLAVYLAGLWLANHELLHRQSIQRFLGAVTWLAQIGMFLVLGLLVFPSRLPEVAGRSLVVVLVLVLVARPLATLVSLTPFRVPLRDQAVVAWVGLRGATPIILATFPLVEGLPEAQLLFDAVFFVVLTSVLLQGTTVGLVADLLGATSPVPERSRAPLEAGEPLADGTALRELVISAGTFGEGRALVELGLPARALVVLIDRGGTYIVPTGSTRLTASDTVLVLADDDAFTASQERLERRSPGDGSGDPG
ncbi:MAG: antiporter [Acidimicrobiales bacterium]|nr:antiporter [Acidimicrobiales bacterium]